MRAGSKRYLLLGIGGLFIFLLNLAELLSGQGDLIDILEAIFFLLLSAWGLVSYLGTGKIVKGKQPIDEGEGTQGSKKKYEVYVDDNFHYMDKSERYKLGDFETCEEAVAACKKIVDEFLEKGYQKGMSFKELYEGYIGFGEDPFIVSDDKKCFFSA